MRLFLILRGLLLPPALILWTGICCFMAIFLNTFFNRRDFDDWVVRTWSKGILKAVGIRVRMRGIENAPAGGVLYLFNHQSLLDIPVIHASIPRSFRFGAKLELFKIPIFGYTMRRVGALPIARGDREEAIKVLDGARVRLHSGESFVLAPEGTRQKQPHVGEFKSGPFVLAIRAQAEVVPVVIRGIHRVLPKKAWLMNGRNWITEVDLEILPVIPGAAYNFEQRHIFKQLVRTRMVEAYSG